MGMACASAAHRGLTGACHLGPAERVSMSFFVRPETVRLEIGGGNWIEVKKRLNVREARKVMASQMKPVGLGEKPSLDFEQVGIAQVREYVVAWGGPDFMEDGRLVQI